MYLIVCRNFLQLVPLSRGFAFKSWIFTVHAEKKLSRGFALSRGFSHARSLHAHFRNVSISLRSAARPNNTLKVCSAAGRAHDEMRNKLTESCFKIPSKMDSNCVDSITAITNKNPYGSLTIHTIP